MTEAILVAAITGCAAVYLLPAIVAYGRRAQHRHGIFVLNVFLGWTFGAWVGALVWAVANRRQELSIVERLRPTPEQRRRAAQAVTAC